MNISCPIRTGTKAMIPIQQHYKAYANCLRKQKYKLYTLRLYPHVGKSMQKLLLNFKNKMQDPVVWNTLVSAEDFAAVLSRIFRSAREANILLALRIHSKILSCVWLYISFGWCLVSKHNNYLLYSLKCSNVILHHWLLWA